LKSFLYLTEELTGWAIFDRNGDFYTFVTEFMF